MYSHVYTHINIDKLHTILSINLSTNFKKSKSYFYRVEVL